MVLSLARSRYTLVLQLIFTAVNSIGLLFGVIYNSKTPDLYPKNAHHGVGWIVTGFVSAQVLISVVGWVSGSLSRAESHSLSDNHAFLPVPTDIEEDNRYRTYDEHDRYPFPSPYRASGDSGQGTEPNTESLRSTSISSANSTDDIPLHSPRKEYEEDDVDLDEVSLSTSTRNRYLATKAAIVIASRLWKYLVMGYRVIDRIILPFGFIAFATGIVTFGRFFVSEVLIIRSLR